MSFGEVSFTGESWQDEGDFLLGSTDKANVHKAFVCAASGVRVRVGARIAS